MSPDQEERAHRLEQLDSLTRRRTRYWCFRIRQEELEGVLAEGAPLGFRESIESLDHFGGWENFGVTWDLDEEDLTRVVPRRYSVEEEWNSQAWASAKDFPSVEDRVKAVEA